MNELNSSFETLFNKMENFVSTKTVVGEPTSIGDVIIVPLVDVSFGVGAGSISGGEKLKDSNSNGGGLGAKIIPSAVMVIQNGTVQLVNIKNENSINKLIDMFPGVMSKLNLNKKDKHKKEESEVSE